MRAVTHKHWGMALFACLGIFSACKQSQKADKVESLTQFVDPYIGSGEHGHVFVGANVPFGFVQLGPSNITEGWDWCSGYHISDSTIWAFTHTHLNGTGIGDLNDIAVMPVVGENITLGRGNIKEQNSGMYSLFNRKSEKVKPGYYAVHLDRYNVDAELTSTKRVGFHKYVFPKSQNSKIVFDLKSAINWDKPTETYIRIENDTTLSGYRYSTGWANDQRVFFTAVLSKPIKSFILTDSVKQVSGNEIKGTGVFAVLNFDTKDRETILVKVALSPTNIENSKLNLQTELPGWDFNKTVEAADLAWNQELNKIKIKTNDNDAKKIFYTALYHTMIAPSEFCDVNKDYMGTDKKIYKNNNFTNYTTFSLWDTYRAAHPLMSIIHPEKMSDIVNTMIAIYQQQGKVPVWHLMGCETNCMVGNPGISVIADAILKGYDGFDVDKAYEAMKKSAMLDERGLKYMKEYGYIPYDKEEEGLSKCMEYAIADWSLAQVAQKLGKTDDYNYFIKRSQSYKHYFDPKTGFVRGLSSDGKFRTPFNPFEALHRANDYTEGTAWQYTWLVPQDIEGLVKLFGSNEKFITKLDSLFVVKGDMGSKASPDIAGLIGQYAHGNEPSHHIIYMYPYVGQPWKTAERSRQILSEMYTSKPSGLSGNEDVGQMSAWYVLSAIGFYQVEPAGGKYIFGSPLFDEVTLHVKDGKTFNVIAHNNSKENKYIQSVKLNGNTYNKFYILFSDIAKGGTLEFEMGNQPSKTWGTTEDVLSIR